MVKLYDLNHPEYGYLEVEVEEFYSNDYPQFFARKGKNTYVRDFFTPIYDVPIMTWGNKPSDGGNLILSPEERDELIAKNPASQKWIRKYLGAKEFIYNLPLYCLWLEDCPPDELHKMPSVYKRVKAVKEFRLASKKAATRRDAETPWLFQERRQPKSNYLLVPCVSGDRRQYIPIDYMSSDIICGNANFMIPDAKYWHFGVLTSSAHMAWMRMVCGRLGMSCRYSAEVVYNPFPWPPFSREVERTASKILTVRRKYPETGLADLYDPTIMPKDLRAAHTANDHAVMEAYDFPKGMTEQQMQTAFLKLYKRLETLDRLFNGK